MVDKTKSKWVQFRDTVTGWLTAQLNAGVAILKPIVREVGEQAMDIGQDMLKRAALDVVQAHKDGTAHGSKEMIEVAKDSLERQAKTAKVQLKATVTTAVAAALVSDAEKKAAQEANPLNKPPV